MKRIVYDPTIMLKFQLDPQYSSLIDDIYKKTGDSWGIEIPKEFKRRELIMDTENGCAQDRLTTGLPVEKTSPRKQLHPLIVTALESAESKGYLNAENQFYRSELSKVRMELKDAEKVISELTDMKSYLLKRYDNQNDIIKQLERRIPKKKKAVKKVVKKTVKKGKK